MGVRLCHRAYFFFLSFLTLTKLLHTSNGDSLLPSSKHAAGAPDPGLPLLSGPTGGGEGEAEAGRSQRQRPRQGAHSGTKSKSSLMTPDSIPQLHVGMLSMVTLTVYIQKEAEISLRYKRPLYMYDS